MVHFLDSDVYISITLVFLPEAESKTVLVNRSPPDVSFEATISTVLQPFKLHNPHKLIDSSSFILAFVISPCEFNLNIKVAF